MENNNTISEMLNQIRLIEKNNLNNIEYTSSMVMLAASNDLAQTKDKELASKIHELNSHIEDINQLTSDLINDLASRHN